MNDFATKITMIGSWLPIETLFEEIKVVVTAKAKFEHGVKSLLITCFGNFGVSKF